MPDTAWVGEIYIIDKDTLNFSTCEIQTQKKQAFRRPHV